MGGVEAVAAEEILGSVSLEKLQECEKDLANVPGLNESQRRAVRAALTRRCTVVQGPPGTGKTTASVQILRLWAKLGLGPILATADGNVAVDNIALGLARCGVDVVRVGSPAKVSASLEAFTLDAKVAQRRAALKQEREAAAAAEREARARRAAEEEERRAECAACPAPCPALRN
jgi:regulator of nonsense transcripts 1